MPEANVTPNLHQHNSLSLVTLLLNYSTVKQGQIYITRDYLHSSCVFNYSDVFLQLANITPPIMSLLVLEWIPEKHKCGVILQSQKLNISQ